MASAAIVGAGVAGRLTALALLRKGWRVTLFERGSRSGEASAGLVAAGMLAPYAELDTAEPLVFNLGLRSMQLWPQLLDQLPAPVFYQQSGTVLVAHRQDRAELERFVGRIRSKLGERAKAQPLDRAALAELEPELDGRFGRGVLFAEEGQVDPSELYPALEQALLSGGVQWHQHADVSTLAPGRVTAEGLEWRGDWVVDARGLGAKADIPGLRGVRGEIITVDAPEVTLNRLVRLMHPRYPLYIAPRRNRRYVIGATSIESEDLSPISVRSMLELLSAAYSVHSGFAEARVLHAKIQLRPALSDHLPRLFHRPGLVRINGLYRHGYLLGPALVEAAVGLVEQGPGGLKYPELLVEESDAESEIQRPGNPVAATV